MRKIVFLFFSIIISCGLYAQESDSLIYWTQDRKLSWDDFQFVHEDSIEGFEKAGIFSGFVIKWDKEDTITISVNVEFDKFKSWTSDTVSSLLLSHELLHFDINEYFARIIRKNCSSKLSNGITNMDLFDTSIDSLINVCFDYQKEYDYETAHGSDTLKQKVWENRVDSLLNVMKAYSVDN